MQIFILTVIFAYLVVHIESKKLTENAGLQPKTMSYSEEEYISIWWKLYKIWRREGTAKENTRKAVMTSYEKDFFFNWESNFLEF